MTIELLTGSPSNTTAMSIDRPNYDCSIPIGLSFATAPSLFNSFVPWAQNPSRPTAALVYQVPHRDEIDLIEKFRALDADWDGYDANEISDGACDAAKTFLANLPTDLESPELCPNPSGTISMEWDSQHGQAQLELGKRKFSFYLRKKGGATIYQNGEAHMAIAICGFLSLMRSTPRPTSVTNITY